MTPERLGEIRELNVDRHRWSHEQATRTIADLLSALDAQSAELTALRAELEALEKAGRAVVEANGCYAAEEAFVSSLDIDEAIDALAALLEKGDSNGGR